jgi:hypothetical protein
MRALKLLVIVMGVLLVGGTAALIAAIIDRASRRAAMPAPALSSGRGFDHASVDLPEGAHVLGVEIAGERLVLRVALAHGGEELVLLDARSGAHLGTIELKIGAAKP